MPMHCIDKTCRPRHRLVRLQQFSAERPSNARKVPLQRPSNGWSRVKSVTQSPPRYNRLNDDDTCCFLSRARSGAWHRRHLHPPTVTPHPPNVGGGCRLAAAGGRPALHSLPAPPPPGRSRPPPLSPPVPASKPVLQAHHRPRGPAPRPPSG